MKDSSTADSDLPRMNDLKQEEEAISKEDGAISGNTSVTVDSSASISASQLYTVLFATSLAGFLYSLDITIITTAIPAITTHFKTIKDIGWYGSAYLITLCSCAPMMGKVYQYYHTKVTFFIFVCIFELGSLICGVAPSSTSFIIGRAIAGIGGAGLFTGGVTIISSASTTEQRSKLISLLYAFSMLGTVLGPIFGGLLTEKASWRWCFYINLPAGGVALAAIAFVRIPDSRDKSRANTTLFEGIKRLDPVGFCLFAPSCIMLLLALQWGGSTYAWHSSTIIGLFVGAAVVIAVFCMWELRRGDSAMVPPSIFASFQIFSYYLPVWFQTILGVSPIRSGVDFLATIGGVVTFSILLGIAVGKIGHNAVFCIVGNSVAAIGGGLMCLFYPSTSTAKWVGYQFLTGVGRGITLQQPVLAVQQNLEPSKMSVGAGLVVFCQFFGGALFLALGQTDFSSSLRSNLPRDAPGVDPALIFNAGATGVRAVVSSDQLPGVLLAYNKAIVDTFYLGVAGSAFAVLVAIWMGLKPVKTGKTATDDQEQS